MKIQQQSTVQNIFDQFSTVFPYLKLEIYRKGHQDSEGSKSEDLISHNTFLKEINPDLIDKTFNIDHDMTVTEFEKMMEDEFCLNIQVFRKSNALWLQTTTTDHWTLRKQNEKGHRSTIDYNIEPVDIRDFDVD